MTHLSTLKIPLVNKSTQSNAGTAVDTDSPLEIAFVPQNLFLNGFLLHLG